MLTLTYIYHSCFLIKAKGICSMIFDFWKPDAESFQSHYAKQEIPSFITDLDPEEPFYVIVSHHHKDHFNPSIFNWIKVLPKVHYIISNDVFKFARHLIKELPEGYVTVLRNGESFSQGSFNIKAYPSTDIGNSYVVSLQGENGRMIDIFHAGDLNAWLWLDESSEQEIRKMMGDYLAALREIKKDHPRLDIAMFPVDSRLGRGYETGAKELLRSIQVDRFFPMHFGLGEPEERRQRERDARRFTLFALPDQGEYIALQAPGDTWAGFPVSR